MRLALIFPTLIIASFSHADINFQCKIKESSFIIMEEGKPALDYGFLNDASAKVFVRNNGEKSITHGIEIDRDMMTFINFENHIALDGDYEWIKKSVHKDKASIVRFLDDQYQIVKISEDAIDLKYFAQWKYDWTDKSVRLQRYYKNDWQGYFVSHVGEAPVIYGLDCRNKGDDILEFIKKL